MSDPKGSKLPLASSVSSGVYAICNNINGKIYIGSAIRIRHRWYSHRHMLRKGNSKHRLLQNSWNKYGEVSFKFIVIEHVEDNETLRDRERYWINELKTLGRDGGLNILDPRNAYSAETRAKISAMSIGHRHSDETKKRMSDSHKGRIVSAETRALLSAANAGRKMSAACCEQNRVAHLGQSRSKEAIEKTAAAHRGVARDNLTREKIRKTLTGRRRPESEIENIKKGVAAKNAKREAEAIVVECCKCGSLFPKRYAFERFCSNSCKQKSFREKRKEARAKGAEARSA